MVSSPVFEDVLVYRRGKTGYASVVAGGGVVFVVRVSTLRVGSELGVWEGIERERERGDTRLRDRLRGYLS